VNRHLKSPGTMIFLLSAVLISSAAGEKNSREGNWPSFRGPGASGIAEGSPLPSEWEFGSSPIVYQDMVLIQCDVLNGSSVAALNIKDGSEVWRTPRNDVPTWGTPTVYADGKNAQSSFRLGAKLEKPQEGYAFT